MRFHFLSKQQLVTEIYRRVSKWMSNYSQFFISSLSLQYYSSLTISVSKTNGWELHRWFSITRWQNRQHSAPCYIIFEDHIYRRKRTQFCTTCHRKNNRNRPSHASDQLQGSPSATTPLQQAAEMRSPLLFPAAALGLLWASRGHSAFAFRLPKRQARQVPAVLEHCRLCSRASQVA